MTLSIKTISKIDIIVTLSITGTNDHKPINDIQHIDTQYKDNYQNRHNNDTQHNRYK
jgi:hypothetical protein